MSTDALLLAAAGAFLGAIVLIAGVLALRSPEASGRDPRDPRDAQIEHLQRELDHAHGRIDTLIAQLQRQHETVAATLGDAVGQALAHALSGGQAGQPAVVVRPQEDAETRALQAAHAGRVDHAAERLAALYRSEGLPVPEPAELRAEAERYLSMLPS